MSVSKLKKINSFTKNHSLLFCSKSPKSLTLPHTSITTLPTRPKVGRTSLICRALKILILKTPDNSCARQCRALILVEKMPETSTGAYVGRNLSAKKASAPDFRASKILKSSARQLRPKVRRVGRVVCSLVCMYIRF